MDFLTSGGNRDEKENICERRYLVEVSERVSLSKVQQKDMRGDRW